MKYLIVVVVILGALFGIQAYTNRSNNIETRSLMDNQTLNSSSTDRLIIEDAKVGTGAEAKTGNKVTVNYTGKFIDGTIFDSSVSHGGQPFSFTLGEGRVIRGWEEGVVGMKEGGMRTLTIPPSLGYGMQDYGPIPGGSTLIFDIELLKVE